jgi:hypothetical protein
MFPWLPGVADLHTHRGLGAGPPSDDADAWQPKCSLCAMDKCPRLLPVFNTQISSTAGNPLLASIAVQAGTATVTDSTGTLWARDRVGFLSGSNMRVEMWYATDCGLLYERGRSCG